ncbi:hypothetical protein [Tenacibaculum sp. M341]|uniref:hypothetical protein n=1 Tax=Tenacibaculum sp. M341 TaxID=2530339 RepID=UPI0010514DCE|nr:hypothetical protein [Tenacibaculum sp. M341]TCI92123.1 hypothetical protein EYW44_08030 [Tenacibaculum sp. M341]
MKKLSYLLFFSASIAFSQSPWTKKKDEAYLQLSFTTISGYTELFAKEDAFSTNREISDNTLQLYAEYGLSDKTTLIANVPLKLVSSGDLVDTAVNLTTESSLTSLGNIQFGVKHNFYNKKWLITGQLMIEANSGDFELASGLRTGYDAWSFVPVVSVGRGFDSWYIQAFTGVDIKTNEYSSAFKLGGELGYKTTDWLWIAGFLDGLASFQNGEVAIPVTNTLTGLYVNNQSFAAFGLKLIGEFNDNFGANLGFGGALSGRRVAKAPALSVGVYYKL